MKKKLLSLFMAAVMIAAFAVPITVSAEDFTIVSGKMLSPNDLAIHVPVTFAGRAAEEFNSEGKTAAVRFDNVGLTPSQAAANRYLLIDGYYKKSSSTTTPYGMSVLFRSNGTSTDDWNHIYAQPDSIKKPSSGLTALPNRWETIAIDCQAAMEYLSTNSLTQKQLQIEIPATTGDDRFYISSVRFSDSTGDFALERSRILTASDLPAFTEEAFKGKTNVMKFANTSGAQTKGIRYGAVHMGYAYASANRYLLVDCYLDDEHADTFDLGVTFRSVNNGNTWINSEATNTQIAAGNAANQWITVAIDCGTPLSNLAANKQSLTQLQLNIPSTTGNFYVGDVNFAASSERPVNYVFEDETGGQYTYLSSDGTVTVDGEALPAYTNTTDAFTGLGAAGGTVYLEGEITEFADVNPGVRGAITLRGLGDSAEDIAANKIKGVDFEIKGGSIKFDYLTIDPDTKGESEAKYSSFFSERLEVTDMEITIGEHVAGTGLGIGNTKGGNTTHWSNHDKVTINGGNFYSITSSNNYTIGQVMRLGTIDYTINGGEINALYAGSNNSWEWENSVVRGDVKYTINGGNFTNYMVMGSAYGSTEIQGNIIWTINGGVMADKRIIGGDGAVTKGKRPQKYLNNVAAIVNLKGGKEGLSTLTLGTDDAKGLDINGNEIYILNNYEDNPGTKIADGSLAEYKLHVYYGKAEPVFANDQTTTVNGSTHYFGGELAGFRLTPDEAGAVPYINGAVAEPDTNGLYQISADTSDIIEIRFPDPTPAEPDIRCRVEINASEAEATAYVINTFDEDKGVLIIFAQYDALGRLIDVKTEEVVVPSGTVSPKAYTVKADSVAEGVDHMGCYVWDGLNSMTPITELED